MGSIRFDLESAQPAESLGVLEEASYEQCDAAPKSRQVSLRFRLVGCLPGPPVATGGLSRGFAQPEASS
jgi:hypothetical protein